MELYYDARTYKYQIWNYITMHGHMNIKFGIILRCTVIRISNLELYYDARSYEYQIWNYVAMHGHMNIKFGIILRCTDI